MAGAFDNHPDLKSLRLSLNDVEMLLPSAFNGATGLEFICMDFNNIKFLEVGALRNLTQLKKLWFNNNLLWGLSMEP